MTRPNPTPPPAGIAFFDVDETLIAVKSMFDFLEFYHARLGSPGVYRSVTDDLHQAARDGVPREEINRRYYRAYAGADAAKLAAIGADWFHTLVERGLFQAEPLAHLAAHRDRGTPIVLLSGSFAACLDPIAAAVGATWAVGTRPVVRDGALTGEVVTPMIGARKARAANAAAAIRGVRLADCAGYGDHASDLPLLQAVGTAYVVGDDPVLARAAEANGWPRLSTELSTEPLPRTRQDLTQVS